MKRLGFDELAAHPLRWGVLNGLGMGGCTFLGTLYWEGWKLSVTFALASGIAGGLTWWGLGILLRRQRDSQQ